MSIGEWVAVVTAAATLSGGAFAIGARSERLLRAAAVEKATAPLEDRVDGLEKDLSETRDTAGRLGRANTAMETQVLSLMARVQSAVQFEKFSEAYINYLRSDADPARDILVGIVCRLYRETQEEAIDIEFTPVSVADVVSGNVAGSLEDLEASGFNADLVRELRELQRGGVTRCMPSVSRLIGTEVSPSAMPVGSGVSVVRKSTEILDRQVGKLIKEVTFPGAGTFRLPDEIAMRVHENPGCRVN